MLVGSILVELCMSSTKVVVEVMEATGLVDVGDTTQSVLTATSCFFKKIPLSDKLGTSPTDSPALKKRLPKLRQLPEPVLGIETAVAFLKSKMASSFSDLSGKKEEIFMTPRFLSNWDEDANAREGNGKEADEQSIEQEKGSGSAFINNLGSSIASSEFIGENIGGVGKCKGNDTFGDLSEIDGEIDIFGL